MGTRGTPTTPLLIDQGADGTLDGTVNDQPGIGPGDGVMIAEIDPTGASGPRIVYANPAFERMTGYSAEEAVGLSARGQAGARRRGLPLG